MEDKVYFTRRGLSKLHKEIKELEANLQRLQSQVSYVSDVGGDKDHDNASYEMLVIDIRGVNHRIASAYENLNKATLVDSPTNLNRVNIGTCVKVIQDGKEKIWNIVGFGESDPNSGMLAYNTPLASLIMGKEEGDTVIADIAGKKTKIEVLEISKGGFID